MVSLLVLPVKVTQLSTLRFLVVFSMSKLWERQGCTLSSRYQNNRIALAVANYRKVAESMSDPYAKIESKESEAKNG
jgi:hypothetical protein